ncbi:hypothetical protein [uncultured Pontibacter sp.]|uniref:hypothetical protein n=1 Tax=uncultured Pontibacter sp. TaxID=453356 RepID=UPI002616BB2E|nr:hypothetical protein [uncultured Pontibacter sp.]
MKATLYLLPLCLLACSPENEEVQEQHVQVAPPAEALDSITDTGKDALRTDENEIAPVVPLPQPVMQLLAAQYQGWERPEIAANAQQQAEEHPGTPAMAHGDFNGDNRADVALQLRQGDELIIVAAVQQQDGKYELVELKRDILFNERGNLKSLYYLYRLPQGEQIQNAHNMNEIELPHDAFVLGVGQQKSVYIYQNGGFINYEMKVQE